MATWECARCHNLFERIDLEEVCPACYPIEEDEFSRIKEYLSKNPGATSSAVMNELKVSLRSIKRYLKQDRLEIIGDNKGFIKCELCGRPLNSGRFCDACYKEGQAMLRSEAGLGLKSAYVDSRKNSSRKRGINYRDNVNKRG